MTDDSNSKLLSPQELIEQATGIIMDHFDVDAVYALGLLRRLSRKTKTQMCEVAEQLINHDVPVEAVRKLTDVPGSG